MGRDFVIHFPLKHVLFIREANRVSTEQKARKFNFHKIKFIVQKFKFYSNDQRKRFFIAKQIY